MSLAFPVLVCSLIMTFGCSLMPASLRKRRWLCGRQRPSPQQRGTCHTIFVAYVLLCVACNTSRLTTTHTVSLDRESRSFTADGRGGYIHPCSFVGGVSQPRSTYMEALLLLLPCLWLGWPFFFFFFHWWRSRAIFAAKRARRGVMSCVCV